MASKTVNNETKSKLKRKFISSKERIRIFGRLKNDKKSETQGLLQRL